MASLRKRLPPLNSLLAFEAAARHESFTAAAKELGMHQPSVSRYIAQLEDFIGQALFMRMNNRLILNEAGRRLWEAVSLGFSNVADVVDNLRDTGDPGVVTIACSFGFAHQWLMARYGELRRAVAPVQVKLLTTDHYIHFDPAEAEISIRFGSGGWPECHVQLLFSEEVYPICSPAFLKRHPELKDLKDPGLLAAMPLLHYDAGGQGWLTWEKWFERQGVAYSTPNDVTYYENYPFQIRATVDGEGISLGWDCLIAEQVARGELVPLWPPMRRQKFGYYLTCPKHIASRPSIRKVFDWFADFA